MSAIISDYLRAEIEAKTNATIEVISKQLDASLQERNSLRLENERLTAELEDLSRQLVGVTEKAERLQYERDVWKSKSTMHGRQATEARAENERLTAERDAIRDYAFEATKAITNLTIGGSEFFGKRIGEMYTADLPYCVEHIRARMGYRMDAMQATARAQAAEAAVVDMRERAAAECDRINDECGMEAGLAASCAAAIRALPTEAQNDA